MSEHRADQPRPPLVWRIPAYQPALLMLVVCAAAAINIYARPSPTVRIVTLAAGLLSVAAATMALRLQLIANDDGVAVRQLLSEAWLPWAELADLEVVPNVRGAPTLRLHRVDGTFVDVPPSLVQPSKPTSKLRARGQLDGLARQLRARRPTAR